MSTTYHITNVTHKAMLTFIILAVFLGNSQGEGLSKLIDKSSRDNCDCNNQGDANQWTVKVEGTDGNSKLGALLTPWHVLTNKDRIKEIFPKEAKHHKVQRYELHPNQNFVLLLLRQPVLSKSQICISPKTKPMTTIPEIQSIITTCDQTIRMTKGLLIEAEECKKTLTENYNFSLGMNEFCLTFKKENCLGGKQSRHSLAFYSIELIIFCNSRQNETRISCPERGQPNNSPWSSQRQL